MTYDKLGYAEAVLTGTAFNELAYERTGRAVLVRSVSGSGSFPTQRRNTVVSSHAALGSAIRVQGTALLFDAAGAQAPVVRFTGVCSAPYVENLRTGKAMKVRVSLEADEELVIDMAAHTVKLDDEMVWGYTGRWLDALPGDVFFAGAEGIGVGFSASVDLVVVGGLITKPVAGAASLSLFSLSRREVNVARAQTAVSERTGRGGRQGVGAAKLRATGGATAQKTRRPG